MRYSFDVLTPVLAMLKDWETQSVPSKQLNSMDISPTSTVQVTPSSFDRRFMEVRTRHAPVPQESIISPTLPITEAFSINPAFSIRTLLSAFA
jgi:hypothetical protein